VQCRESDSGLPSPVGRSLKCESPHTSRKRSAQTQTEMYRDRRLTASVLRIRQEEKAALLEAVENLRLRVLQLQASEVNRKRERVKEVAKALNVFSTSPVHHEFETSLLRDAVRAQHLSIAHVQSAVSSYVVRAVAESSSGS
jgi:diphthamide synthase (EF-2-diphthine--ammonia ligase)